jgi:hypothetical protein
MTEAAVPEPELRVVFVCWGGTPAGVYGTLGAIEAAMPGVLDRVRELLQV